MTRLSTSLPVNVALVGGRIELTGDAMVRFWHSSAELNYRDIRVRLHHGNDVNATANDYTGTIVRRIDPDNMLIGAVTGTRLHAMKFEDGVLWDIASVALPTPLAGGEDYWIQTIVSDDLLRVEHWDTDPGLAGAPLTFVEHTLAGTEIVKFIPDRTYWPGVFWWQPDSWATAWIDDFRYEPVKMDNMLVIELNQRGNYTAKPVIELIGQMSEIRLTNLMNDSTMVIEGLIPEGMSYFADVEHKTFTDRLGNNVYDQFATESDWVKLEDGFNQLAISTDSNRGDSGVKITWRHSTI